MDSAGKSGNTVAVLREFPGCFLSVSCRLIGFVVPPKDVVVDVEIAKTIGDLKSRADLVTPVITKEAFLQMRREIYDVYVKDVVYDYLLRLVAATRNHIYIERGASPRATIALVKMARAYAWLNGRKYVVPNDVLIQLPYVLAHRIIMSAAAQVGSLNKYEVIEEIARTVKIPYMGVKR